MLSSSITSVDIVWKELGEVLLELINQSKASLCLPAMTTNLPERADSL